MELRNIFGKRLISVLLIFCALTSFLPEAHADSTADERKQLAQKILDNNDDIYLSDSNKSAHYQRKQDGANAKKNIKDTAAGNQAKRSSYADPENKLYTPAPGGSVDLDVNMLRAILDVVEKFGYIRISAIAGSCHSKGSKHYDGIAFDSTEIGHTGDVTKERGREVYNYLTSLGYEIKKFGNNGVYEDSSHYHIQVNAYKPVGYIRECKSDTPCNAKLIVSRNDAVLFSQPCNSDIAKRYNYESVRYDSVRLNKGTELEATGIVKNSEGNWWFRVKDLSGDGQEDYIGCIFVETPDPVVQEYGSCVNVRAKNNNAVTYKYPVNHEFWQTWQNQNNEVTQPNIGLLAVAVVQNIFGEYWYKLSSGRYIAGSQVDVVKTDWERAEDGFRISSLSCPSGVVARGTGITFSGAASSSTAAISEISAEVLTGSDQKAKASAPGSGQKLDLQLNCNTVGYEPGSYAYSVKIKLSSYRASNINQPEKHEFVYKKGQFEVLENSFLSAPGAEAICDVDLQVKFGSQSIITPIIDAKTGKTKNEIGGKKYRALKIVWKDNAYWYQVLYDNGKTGYINSIYYSEHTVNEKPTINANADVSAGRATVSGNISIPAWMTLKSAQINSDIGCHLISNLDGGSYRMTLPGTFSAGTHSLTAKVYSTYQFAKNGKLEKGSCESSGYSFKVTVPSEQNPANPAVVAQTAAEKEYLEKKCTAYPAYLSLYSNSSSTKIKTLPCSKGTNDYSKDVKQAEKGEPLKAIGLYKNSVGNYWYQVILKDGRMGFIYAGDTELAPNYKYDDALKVSLDNIGTVTWGDTKTVKGTVSKSAYLGEMSAVGYLFNPDGSKSSESSAVVSSAASIGLKGTRIDKDLKFANLNHGLCTLCVTVTADSHYSPDGKNLGKIQLRTTEYLDFTVKPLSVSYDANGGSNAPGTQTVKYNKSLKLSNTTPKKGSSEFLGWATGSGSTTVDYKPGATIKNIKKDIRLYAVWKSIIVCPIDQTHFPDDNFRSYISSTVDADGDGNLSSDEVEQTIDIDCSSKSIASLTGIEYFTALRYLICNDNQLTNLDVSKNTALEQLYCANNQLTSLDVSGCTALTHFDFCYNQLTNLDVTNSTALRLLWGHTNQLVYLDVSNNTALTVLNCSSNQLTSLDVSKNTAIGQLYCDNNQLTSLDVSKNTALYHFLCDNNQLTSLDVSSNTALTYLACGSNQLTNLDVSSNTALTHLSCSNNQLTTLDVSGCASMGELWCAHNQLISLNVSGCTALTDLSCFDNQLIILDVSSKTALTHLSCFSNQLISLNVSGCTELTDLYCSYNQLTSLDVSNNTALTSLDCIRSQLTSLDVSGCTALTDLKCYENQLTSLNVSGCTALTGLYCSYNQLTSLDVSSNTALTDLECSNNHLTSLDVSNNTALELFYCDYNSLEVTSDLLHRFDLCTLSGFDINRASDWDGGSINGSILTFKSDKVTYTYDIGNSSLENPVFTLTTTLMVIPDYISIDEESFPDSVFRQYVSDNIDTDHNGYLSNDEASVKGIYCQGMSILDLKGIEYFTELTDLVCYNNQLTSLDLSRNTALTYLSCSQNQLPSLDLSNNTALEELYCDNNQLPSLDVSNCTVLTNLRCENNQLTNLNVSGCTALTDLSSNDNQLTSLDVSGCTALTYLWCENNQLISLDLSNNAALKQLYCAHNQLTSLDLSKNTALTYLACYSNSLTVPTVSGRFDLSTLPGFDASRTSNWNGGTLNGSVLTFRYQTVTYTYDLGNSNIENPTFTLKSMATTEPGTVSAVALELSESDFGSGSTVNLKGVFTVPEEEKGSFGWQLAVYCNGNLVSGAGEFPLNDHNGTEITATVALVPGLTYTYQAFVVVNDGNGSFTPITESDPISFTMPQNDGTIPEIEPDQEFEIGVGLALYKFTAAETGTYEITSSGYGFLIVYSQDGNLLGLVNPDTPAMNVPSIVKGDTIWIAVDSVRPMKVVISLQNVTSSIAEAKEQDEEPAEEEPDAEGEEDPAEEIPAEEFTESPNEENPPEQTPETQAEAEKEAEPSESVSTEQPAEEPPEGENSESDEAAPPKAIPPEQTAAEDLETTEPASQPSLPIE